MLYRVRKSKSHHLQVLETLRLDKSEREGGSGRKAIFRLGAANNSPHNSSAGARTSGLKREREDEMDPHALERGENGRFQERAAARTSPFFSPALITTKRISFFSPLSPALVPIPLGADRRLFFFRPFQWRGRGRWF